MAKGNNENKGKRDFTQLLNKVQETPIAAPIQKVVPLIKEVKEIEETKYSFWIPEDYLEALRHLALKRSTRGKKVYIKDLINDAIYNAYKDSIIETKKNSQ